MRFRLWFGLSLVLACGCPGAPVLPLVPPVPTPEQRAWQDLELTLFVHFGINTFTDREWGLGNEDPALFNPGRLDARQWARAAKAGGFKLMILTAKHHDGFCLWPSQFTTHSVARSPWKGGKGDVVREFVEACRAENLKVGLYLSPWDRHERTYGTDAYNTYFTNQLAELLTRYGPIDEVWFDGACGEGPNGKRQVYNWPAYYATIRALAPKAVIAISGPDVRWVGNESGVARVGESSVQPASAVMHGRSEGKVWWPAECDVSIRPGWFYHAAEDAKVKTLRHLLDIYFKSVGRNSVMLLNVPPNKEGLFADPDVRRLEEFGDAVRRLFARDLARNQPVEASSRRAGPAEDFAPANAVDGEGATFWAGDDGVTQAELVLKPAGPVTFNLVSVREPYWFGERTRAYRIEAGDASGAWQVLARGTVIGSRNLLSVPETTATRVRLVIESAAGCPAINEFALYHSDLAPAPRPISLTTHKPARASNVHPEGTTYGADRAVDGDPDTRWATAYGISQCWLEVDLGECRTIGQVAIVEFAPRINRFRILYREDPNAGWAVAYEGKGQGRQHSHRFQPVQGRYLRLDILEASAPPTIWEFDAFEK
jgi:alpha-L-fucosidase